MKLVKKFLPKYALIPTLFVIVFVLICYYCTKIIDFGFPAYDLTDIFGIKLPIIPFFIIFYVLAYLQWFISYYLIAKESPQVCYKYFSSEIIAKILGMLIFIFLPTYFTRVEIVGTDFFSRLIRLIYASDTPTNLFPSFHCLYSWICLRSSFEIKRIRKWYVPVSVVFTLLVFASTLFVGQHVIIDIAGGVVFAELGISVSRITHADKLFEIINNKIDSHSSKL